MGVGFPHIASVPATATWAATAQTAGHHYRGSAVAIGTCVFLALLAVAVFIGRGGRRR